MQLLDKELDYEKLTNLTSKIGLSRSDVKAALAAVNFLLDCATRYDVDRSVLGIEMQQLGLPRETTATMLNIYFANKSDIEQSYRTKEFNIVSTGSIRWRMDYILGSSVSTSAQMPNLKLNFAAAEGKNPIEFEISISKFRVLLSELKAAQAVIQNLEN